MFPTKLRELREAAGYKSQQAFADAFGIAQSTVGNWEAGKREPNYTTTKKLADFFHVPIDYLIGSMKAQPYSEQTSKKICAEIADSYQKTPEKFQGFLVPYEIWDEILAGTYQFNTVTFPQFSEIIGKTLEDIIVPDTTDGEAQLKAAFFDGYSDDLSQQEIDEYWNDAKEYLRFKIERRKKRKG